MDEATRKLVTERWKEYGLTGVLERKAVEDRWSGQGHEAFRRLFERP